MDHVVSNPDHPPELQNVIEQQNVILASDTNAIDDIGQTDLTAWTCFPPADEVEHSGAQEEQASLPPHRPESVVQGRYQMRCDATQLLIIFARSISISDAKSCIYIATRRT